MKKLFLFTLGFPYPGQSMETYLETECKYYDQFSEVNICSLEVKKEDLNKKRDIGNAIVAKPVIFGSKISYLIASACSVFDPNFYKEIWSLIKKKRIDLGKICRLCKFIGRAHYDARIAKKSLGLDKNSKISDAILYSYRFEYQSYVCYLLLRYFDNPIFVARAHRYDLYEDSNPDEYIPCRNILLDKINMLFLISQDGKNYVETMYPKYKDKYKLSYLGTTSHGRQEYQEDKEICIVSCSTVIPVKRLERIIEVLSIINIDNVKWIHFGSGNDIDKVKELASIKLAGKISYEFKGSVSNEHIMEFYKHNSIKAFINLSDSEGIPVSIMEALSFGIPCVATDVGGTSEIVINGYNGILVDPKEDNSLIAKSLDGLLSMPQEEYIELRNNARTSWEKSFNAERNYREFIEVLSNL